MSSYRGRFAPSPTGPLHFGSLIAALASYCDARARGGTWHLRIDDGDEPRSRDDATAEILRALDRYGFAHDGEITYQRHRVARYGAALHELQRAGRVFACRCSRRKLADSPLGANGERIYPGTCREATHAHVGDELPAWRFRVDSRPVRFVDRLQGAQEQRLDRDVGDFTVLRADGFYAYQLAVVVDDAESGVTDVVRGADLLVSTPRQLALQDALGFLTPKYLHVPVAVDRTGAKLSKQTNAPALPEDPLPALAKAWRFLDQPPLPPMCDVSDFWKFAIARWDARRLPPVTMLPSV